MNTNQPSSTATISPRSSLVSINELLTSSTNLFKKNIKLFTGIAGILMLLSITIGFAQAALVILWGMVASYKIETALIPLLKASIIFLQLFLISIGLVAYAWLSGSLTIAVSKITSGKATTIKKALEDGWLIKWSFLLVTVLFGLVIGAGMVLLIIPGIIFFMWYFLCTYTLVCKNLKGWAALSRSKELVRGHWWRVAIRVLLLCAILGGISLIISFIPFFGEFMNVLFYQFIALPFSTICFFNLYKNLETIRRLSSPSEGMTCLF